VDGVFKTQANEYHAYQAKFRANRPTLTHTELSTFLAFAEPDKVARRVVITNCDAISRITRGRGNLYWFSGTSLTGWNLATLRDSGMARKPAFPTSAGDTA